MHFWMSRKGNNTFICSLFPLSGNLESDEKLHTYKLGFVVNFNLTIILHGSVQTGIKILNLLIHVIKFYIYTQRN